MLNGIRDFMGNGNSDSRKEKDTYQNDVYEKNLLKRVHVITVVNQKGGCGKTTTCLNLASGLARRDLRVLIIDLDPQAHASLGTGVDVHNCSGSIYDVLVKGAELQNVIVSTYQKNLYVAPATSLLTGAQLEIADVLGRENLLKSAITRLLHSGHHYDYILMDCSPSLNLLTINSLVATQSLLIPIQAHYFSLEGMRELFSTINIVRDRMNPELEVLGILPTIFDGRTKMSRDVLDQLKGYFKEKMLKSVIRMNIRLAEAPVSGKAIFDFDPICNGARDYGTLTEEIVRLTRPEFATGLDIEAATARAIEAEMGKAIDND